MKPRYLKITLSITDTTAIGKVNRRLATPRTNETQETYTDYAILRLYPAQDDEALGAYSSKSR